MKPEDTMCRSVVSPTSTAPMQTPPDTPEARIDFAAVATSLINEHGFAVVPVVPPSKDKQKNKEGVPGWSSYNLMTSPARVEEVLQQNPEFANYNVGVFASCGYHYEWKGEMQVPVGNLCILDVDADGVLEQIKAENPGEEWPSGYTVCSRPQTAPYKRHHYFRHTRYSIRAFKELGGGTAKEISQIRDPTKPVNEKGLHPNRYDVKGSGKGGYVVGAGSVREKGEKYTCIDNGPVPDIPNWLVNWICNDVRKYRYEVRRQRKAQAEKPVKEQRPQDARRKHLNSRAGDFARRGVRRETIELLHKEQAEDFSPHGIEFAASEEGKALFHKIAFNPNLEIGNSDWFYTPPNYRGADPLKPKKPVPAPVPVPLSSGHGVIVTGGRASLRGALTDAIWKFPRDKTLSIAYVRTHLESAMLKGKIAFDWNKHREQVSRAREHAGWTSTGGRYAKWFYGK